MPFSPIKLIALLLAALAFAFTPSGTSAEGWGTSYDELFEEAGASVKRYKTKDGTEVREFISKGGVQIRQERKSGDIQTMTTDLQHGPVFCFWVIAVSVHAVLETCEEAIRPALAKRLDVTIDKLNRFIAANAWERQRSPT